MSAEALHWRPRRSLVLIVASCLEVMTMALLGLITTHHEIIGLTGALAVLIAVIAAVLGGPLAGAAVSLAGGVGFFVFVGDLGHTAPLPGTLAAIVVWALSAVMSGLVAERLRHQEASRRSAERESSLLHARLEASLLPQLAARTGPLDVVWRYLPSEGRLGLSGDFYDVAVTPAGEAAVVIGDVVGHGPRAAALGATLRAAWHALVLAGVPEQRVVAAMEQIIAHGGPAADTFVTACLAWFDKAGSGLRLVRLGHPPPLLLSGSSVTELKGHADLPLGVDEAVSCHVLAHPLPLGWTLLLYTDGLIEGRNGTSAERFGAKRLLAHLDSTVHAGFGERELDALLERVIRANNGPLPDDVAVLLVSSHLTAHAAGRVGGSALGRREAQRAAV